MALEKSEREEGLAFLPKFGEDGLLTCVTVDARDGDVLMVAHMNPEALQKTLETGEPFELDLEVILPGGTRKWITGRGEGSRSVDGHVVQVQGTIQEITERKNVEEALRDHAELLDLAHDMIMVCALDGTIRFWNHGAE